MVARSPLKGAGQLSVIQLLLQLYYPVQRRVTLVAPNRYEVEAVEPAIALLTTGPADGTDRILTLFEGVVAALQNGDQRGCLLCSAAAGPSAVDTDISNIVQVQLRKMGQAFYVALTQSTAKTDQSDQDHRDLAGLLLSQYVGLWVIVRSNAPIEAIRESVDAIRNVVCQRQ